MALLIQTTGLEDYAPGGKARVKVLLIGGPGAGKTRWASYFPKPIYADCEKGMASVADRHVPYARIGSSEDMLDLLAKMKFEARQSGEHRKYDTFIVDTLDAFQRMVKNEWMELNNKEVFTGWEAWGYLNAKMQLLMTRLLNLDMNIVVNVHFKSKTTKDDESGKESHELMLQLQGESADTTFNDFDLVGWMGTYWEAVDGERVQKRGITFQARPDKPFLKDRLNVTPPWLNVTFADSDYTNLFDRIQARVATLDSGAVIDQVESAVAEPRGFVIPPGAIGSGPMPAAEVKDVPLAQLDKPTLAKMCRDAGVKKTIDGSPIKANTLKSELLAALEAERATTPATAAETPQTPDAPPAAAEPAATQAPARQSTQQPMAEAAQLANVKRVKADTPSTRHPETKDVVDVTNWEILDDSTALEAAVQVSKDVLGAVVIEDKVLPVPVDKPAEPAQAAPEQFCDDCGRSLSDQRPDIVKIAWIRFRKHLDEDCYAKRKSNR